MWIKIGCVHLHISKSYELTLDHNLLWNEFAHSLKDRKSQTFMNSLQICHVFKSMKDVVQIKSKSLIIKSVLLCRVPQTFHNSTYFSLCTDCYQVKALRKPHANENFHWLIIVGVPTSHFGYR